MFKHVVCLATLSLTFPAIASAELVYTIAPVGTTAASGTNLRGGNEDGTGVWFNVLTGYTEIRSDIFPSPLFEDGKYFLFSDARFIGTPANIFTQGFFSRGNGVIYTSSTNLNPARFQAGDVIGPDTGFQSPGAGFADLGPNFGNWPTPGRGFLGFTIRDPAGTSAFDIFYGFADITVEEDYGITLNAFGYENVRRQPVTLIAPPILGDFNFDGGVDASDIDPFVVAANEGGDFTVFIASAQSAFASLYPNLTLTPSLINLIGDLNADGGVDASDIDPFVTFANSGGLNAAPIPEPLGLGLLLPAALILTRRR